MEHLLEDPTFWVAIAFVCAVAIVFRPLSKLALAKLDGRRDEIARNLDEARRLREEAQELLASYERKQREARKEIDQIMARAEEEADRLVKQASKELEEAVEQRRQQAMDRIRQAETDAMREVHEVAVRLALRATRQLLAESTDDSEHARLVDEAIREIGTRMH